MDPLVAKQRVLAEVEHRSAALLDVSHQIHAHPELGFEETYAHRVLTDVLEAEGLGPTREAYGLGTAFEAEAGTSGPLVAVLCEYDALPDIGHACGHNIIAAAGLGAGLAAAALADELGGRIRILGTPAEEGGGGKVHLMAEGAFDGVDAALMVHPAGADLRSMDAIAIRQLEVTYHGRPAHAAAAPHRGRNALDAAVLGYVNVAALRQHIRADERVHGVITHGGDKPNIVPHLAAAEWYVRAGTLDRLDELCERVVACLHAGAEAAGVRCDLVWRDPSYADLRVNTPLLDLFADNAAALGRTLLDPAMVTGVVGSTDMGNVSYVVPSIHPMLKSAPATVGIHTPEFTGHAGGPEGDQAVIDGAKAMAMTVVDLWLQPEALASVRAAFEPAALPESARGRRR
jgi:amidohydrolase